MAASPRSIPNDYRLMIHGLVDKPLIFTLDDLKRLPRVNRIYFLECAANSGMEWRGAQLNGCQYTHGMIHCVQYTGVPLKLLLEQAGLKPNAKWIMVEGGDAAGDEPLAADDQGARRLHDRLSHERRDAAAGAGLSGAPRRAGLGRQYVGQVAAPHRRSATSPGTRARKRRNTPTCSRTARRAKFTFVMDAKSVITSPSPQAPVKQKGFHVISGLAWSGRGKVKRVDVSLDGGRNWRAATHRRPGVR